MGARKLVANVNIAGVLYGPDGETPSAEVAEQITNPKAWGADEDTDESEFPEGEPVKDWTAQQLTAWAAANAVDLDGATSKKDIVAKLGLDQS